MNERRYRDAERALWHDAGPTPTEHHLALPRAGVEVRVLETGDGPPVLFLHGGPGAAGSVWAHLAARLPDLRCLLLDRPGTGLSAPNPLTDPGAVLVEADTLVADVLDALSIDDADLVASSHGSFVALRSSAAHPHRVRRTVHLGCPGFVEGMALRGFDRLVLAPGAARVFAGLPSSETSLRSTFRQLGHADAVAAGSIPASFITWATSLARDTDTMRNELASMSAMGTFRRGFDPSLTLDASVLGSVDSPTHVVWGTSDPYGDATVARRLVDALPEATLELLPGAGHLCWLDDPDHVADAVRRHLRG